MCGVTFSCHAKLFAHLLIVRVAQEQAAVANSNKTFRETMCEYYGSYKAQMKEGFAQLELVPEVQVKRLEINDIGATAWTKQ